MMPSPPAPSPQQPLTDQDIIHSDIRHLLSTYWVPSPVVGTGEAAGNCVDMVLGLHLGQGTTSIE